MALVKSQTWTSISGSVGGVTWAHSKSGFYMRARTIPVDPASQQQVLVRSALTDAVTRWTELLEPFQRETWEAYAQNVPVTNPLGDVITLSGQNWYVAANTPRIQANATLALPIPLETIDEAPELFDRGDFTTPESEVSTIDGIGLSFETDDEWVSEDGSAMLIFQARPSNPSRLFFKGPYRLVGIIIGNSTTPPVSPFIVSASQVSQRGFQLVAGQATQVVVAVTRSDGRISTRRVTGPVGGIGLGRQLVT